MNQLESLIQPLIDMLFSGIGDSGTATIIKAVLSSYMPSISRMLMNSATGTSGFPITLSDLTANPNSSMVANAYRSMEALQRAHLYGFTSNIAAERTTQSVTNLYRHLGYSAKDARIASYGTAGRLIGMGLNAFGNINSGVTMLSGAAYRRRNMLTTGGALESVFAQARGMKQFIGDLATADNNQLGGLDFNDAAQLGSKLIASGKYDEYGGYGRGESRYTKLKSDIQAYGRSLDKLKDVIDGDMSKILDTMDRIFGGTTLNASSTKISRLASAVQHSGLVTGLTAKDLASMTAIGYGYISDVGGSQQLSARMALDASYYAAAGNHSEYLTDSSNKSYLMKARASVAASGVDRYVNAAFNAWLVKNNKKPTAASEAEFLRDYRGGGYSLTAASARKYLTRVTGGNAEAMAEYINGRYTTQLMETTGLGGEAFSSVIDGLISQRRTTLNSIIKGSRIANLFGDVNLNDRNAVLARFRMLANGQADSNAIMQLANRFSTVDDVNLSAWGNVEALNNAMINQPKARAMRTQQLWGQSIAEAVRLGGSGGLKAFLQAKSSDGNDQIRDTIAQIAGVSLKKLRAEASSENFEAKYGWIEGMVPGAESKIGMFKVAPGASEKQTRAALINYMKTSRAVETALRSYASTGDGAGAISDAEIELFNDWAASTEFNGEGEKALIERIKAGLGTSDYDTWEDTRGAINALFGTRQQREAAIENENKILRISEAFAGTLGGKDAAALKIRAYQKAASGVSSKDMAAYKNAKLAITDADPAKSKAGKDQLADLIGKNESIRALDDAISNLRTDEKTLEKLQSALGSMENPVLGALNQIILLLTNMKR